MSSAVRTMASSSVSLMRWGSSAQPVKSAPAPDLSAKVWWAFAARSKSGPLPRKKLSAPE